MVGRGSRCHVKDSRTALTVEHSGVEDARAVVHHVRRLKHILPIQIYLRLHTVRTAKHVRMVDRVRDRVLVHRRVQPKLRVAALMNRSIRGKDLRIVGVEVLGRAESVFLAADTTGRRAHVLVVVGPVLHVPLRSPQLLQALVCGVEGLAPSTPHRVSDLHFLAVPFELLTGVDLASLRREALE